MSRCRHDGRGPTSAQNCANEHQRSKAGSRNRIASHALNAGGSVCLQVLAGIGLVPVRPGGSFARRFASRPQEAGNIDIRK
jgi:hypothetical protein